jgi:shikimate kinase
MRVDGYYDHHPTLSIARPVALVGFMGAGVSETAYAVSARTGLTFTDVERLAEHQGGGSRGRHERAVLEAALRRTPAGVIALGDGSLLEPAARMMVRSQATTVYLRADVDTLMRRLARELAAAPTRYFPWLKEPLQRRAVEALLAEREPWYRQADFVLDVGDSRPLTVAGRVVSEFLAPS